MSDGMGKVVGALCLVIFGALWFGPAAAVAQDASWRVSKASGDVWFAASGAQPVALTTEAALKAGDTVRTGQNGRVLLVRGTESILVSANSIVGLPAEPKDGLSTVILQQAGTILLDVQKRNVPHFEVTTPYLAAVVKGTQFRVTVDEAGSQVDVLRGQVQVTDYRTGQYALINPSQAARVSAQGSGGLSLSGSGLLSPIQQGTPYRPSLSPLPTPKDGAAALSRPQDGWRSAASQEHSADSGRASEFGPWAKEVLGLNNRRGKDDDLSLLWVPAFAGLVFAVGAAVFKRRKKK